MTRHAASLILAVVALAACWRPGPDGDGPPADAVQLRLPEGFRAEVVVDSIGPARHLAVSADGDVYVKLRRSTEAGSIVALRDTTGDGRADVIARFGAFEDEPGGYHTEARIRDGYLYVSTQLRVYRFRLTPGRLVPDGPPDTLVFDDHAHGAHEHITKPVAFDGRGGMYVPFGAPNNACQEPKRTPGVPGRDPCPDLDDHGGIWRFDADATHQTQAAGRRVATGLRSIVGMDWNPVDGHLYAVVHGRDDLHRLWPDRYSPWDNALLPAEELVRVTEGADFGWPYCYYDPLRGEKVLAPEYGGDGEAVGRCSAADDPLIGFPGHFAPNDILFYRGEQFPAHYRNGAFIAFHGSTIRNPYPQAGYFVAFVPFRDGAPTGDWEVFANGFAVADPIENTSDARHRPVGLAAGPDGSLYVTESVRGRTWRIRFTGDRGTFGPAQRARMEQEKRTASNIRTPDAVADDLRRSTLDDDAGSYASVYMTYCVACHQSDGRGAPPRFPPLAGSEWVTGDKERLISVIVNGLEGAIEVDGEPYDGVMPQHGFLTDAEVAQVATYVRTSFGNDAGPVRAEEVRAFREAASTSE